MSGRSTQPMSSEAGALITPDEFRRQIGDKVGRNFVYEAIRANRIRHIRIGRKILVLASEVSEWPLREATERAA